MTETTRTTTRRSRRVAVPAALAVAAAALLGSGGAAAAAAPRSSQDGNDGLVRVAPAPPKAEISIGLVPQGFQYLSRDSADAYYGPAGLPPGKYFSKGLVVDVHLTVPGTKFPLLIDGMPGSYHKSEGYTLVRVEYSKKVDIGFQAPPNASLNKAQALKIASTFDVRSTKRKTKG